MFELFLGFLPWILFLNINSTALSLMVALIAYFKQLKQNFFFAWGGIVFFLMYWLLENFMTLSSDKIILESLGLVVIIVLSLLLKKPFTLDYARLFTPKIAWKFPEFIQINQRISTVWAILFGLSAMSNSLFVMNAMFVIGFIFSLFFPDVYKNHQRRLANQNNPFLQGNFAPVHEESDFEDLVVEGIFPETFPDGIYVRNGPNPQFEPISYVYPFDGDGMIHALYFKHQKISYKNRFVKTLGFEVEKRAGKAVYGGIKMPLPIDESYLLPGESNSPFKNGAFIHVIPFAKRILALLEANPAYELDFNLNTKGLFKAGQKIAPNLNAHVKICPDSGDMYAISYDLNPPYLVLHHISASGILMDSIAIEKAKPTMIHDFVITQNHLIIVDCPVVFDVDAAMKGASVLQWHEAMGVDVRIFNRYDLHAPQKIIHHKAFFVFHFANAYEDKHNIFLDFIYYDYFKIFDDRREIPGMVLHRMSIDLANDSISDERLCDVKFEFPSINLKYLGKTYRYIYGICKQHSHLGPIRFDSIIKYDLKNKSFTTFDFGEDYEIGETLFIPSKVSLEEDDGFLIVYAYELSTNQSYAYLLDAKNFQKKPVCRILIPKRVPFGLHGSWFNV